MRVFVLTYYTFEDSDCVNKEILSIYIGLLCLSPLTDFQIFRSFLSAFSKATTTVELQYGWRLKICGWDVQGHREESKMLGPVGM